jgi:hypothetical protein
MKVPALEENMDARIILQRNIDGIIPMERCYIDGMGQYWYNISGKQALDSYTKLHVLEYSVFENLIIRICEQLEVLEWNLLDGNGLLLDPELIFFNSKGDDVSFVFYPHSNRNILKEIQKLMEYLLSKLNHANHELVKGAYEIYEMTQCENYQLQELKHVILKHRITKTTEEKIFLKEEEIKVIEHESVYGYKEKVVEQTEKKLSRLSKKVKHILMKHPKEEIPEVVYPQEDDRKLDLSTHPTICISTTIEEPRGVLIYEGVCGYPNFELDRAECVIGKSTRANIQINRETISNFHAKIECADDYYIEDMNSTNGTFVNDEILNYREKRLLNVGDIIQFADVKYRFL